MALKHYITLAVILIVNGVHVCCAPTEIVSRNITSVSTVVEHTGNVSLTDRQAVKESHKRSKEQWQQNPDGKWEWKGVSTVTTSNTSPSDDKSNQIAVRSFVENSTSISSNEVVQVAKTDLNKGPMTSIPLTSTEHSSSSNTPSPATDAPSSTERSTTLPQVIQEKKVDITSAKTVVASSTTSVVPTTTSVASSTTPVTTVAPSTAPVTTIAPSTAPVTTIAPSTAPVTTIAPSTAPVTTIAPSTAPVTTVAPSTAPVTTIAPSTAPVTTVAPSAAPVTAVTPSTEASTLQQKVAETTETITTIVPSSSSVSSVTFSSATVASSSETSTAQEKVPETTQLTTSTVSPVSSSESSPSPTDAASTLSISSKKPKRRGFGGLGSALVQMEADVASTTQLPTASSESNTSGKAHMITTNITDSPQLPTKRGKIHVTGNFGGFGGLGFALSRLRTKNNVHQTRPLPIPNNSPSLRELSENNVTIMMGSKVLTSLEELNSSNLKVGESLQVSGVFPENNTVILTIKPAEEAEKNQVNRGATTAPQAPAKQPDTPKPDPPKPSPQTQEPKRAEVKQEQAPKYVAPKNRHNPPHMGAVPDAQSSRANNFIGGTSFELPPNLMDNIMQGGMDLLSSVAGFMTGGGDGGRGSSGAGADIFGALPNFDIGDFGQVKVPHEKVKMSG